MASTMLVFMTLFWTWTEGLQNSNANHHHHHSDSPTTAAVLPRTSARSTVAATVETKKSANVVGRRIITTSGCVLGAAYTGRILSKNYWKYMGDKLGMKDDQNKQDDFEKDNDGNINAVSSFQNNPMDSIKMIISTSGMNGNIVSADASSFPSRVRDKLQQVKEAVTPKLQQLQKAAAAVMNKASTALSETRSNNGFKGPTTLAENDDTQDDRDLEDASVVELGEVATTTTTTTTAATTPAIKEDNNNNNAERNSNSNKVNRNLGQAQAKAMVQRMLNSYSSDKDDEKDGAATTTSDSIRNEEDPIASSPYLPRFVTKKKNGHISQAPVAAATSTTTRNTATTSNSEIRVLMQKGVGRSPAQEARVQAHYAAIESVEERAFQILLDLGMVDQHAM